MARYPTTLKLAFGSTLLGILIGVSAGIVSAVKQYSLFDRIFTTISLFGASAPSFWIAMVLVLIFSPLFYVLIETVFGKQYRGKTGGTDTPSLFDRLTKKIFGRQMEQKSASTDDTNPSEVN